ncbi:MAG: magnesium/cobalt transporter CorA [Anaerolineales bacterium]|nr:magnesium/cobalt transporter CorA [Anaerolineales bacterium]
MNNTLYLAQDKQLRTDLSFEAIITALQDTNGLLWIDLVDEPVESCRTLLIDIMNFHPLAVDDALEENHVPKVDDWGQYLYLVLHAILYNSDKDAPISTQELDIFLGKNYMVTYHPQEISALNRVRESCQRDNRHMQKGPVHLLYWLCDELVTDYMPVMEQIDEQIDDIEDQVFGEMSSTLLGDIFTLKRGLLHLRRIIAPQREVLNKLARGGFVVIGERYNVYFRDVYDHLVRLYDIAEGMRDLVGGALDAYLSVVNNRMNDVMKTLTVITTLFMPVSFLVGFFGTNFFQAVAPLEAWTSREAFVAMIAAMVIVPAGMYLWMRKRAWM